MKSLKECVVEGLLDKEDKVFDIEKEGIIKKFLEENYAIDSYEIKTSNNRFVVDVKGRAIVKNKYITSLTNELFEFGEVRQDFNCSGCDSLTSLEGAPKKVGGDFDCRRCGVKFEKEDVKKYTNAKKIIV